MKTFLFVILLDFLAVQVNAKAIEASARLENMHMRAKRQDYLDYDDDLILKFAIIIPIDDMYPDDVVNVKSTHIPPPKPESSSKQPLTPPLTFDLSSIKQPLTPPPTFDLSSAKQPLTPPPTFDLSSIKQSLTPPPKHISYLSK